MDFAEIGIKVDTTGLKKAKTGLDDLGRAGDKTEGQVKRATDSMKTGFSSLTKTIGFVGVALAAVAGGAAIRAVIRNTIEQEKAVAQLNQTLKSTGRYNAEVSKSLQNVASALQGVTTYGDEAIIKSQALLLTFKQIGGPEFGRAQKSILDVATAMGTDLKSAAIQVGKALNDPVLGLSALSRSGITFSDSQKAVIKSLVETGDAAAAQRIMLDELESQFGGSAEAARNTLGGSLEALKNTFGDLLEGDSGGDGVRGATQAINDLTATLNDPDVKQGFQDLATGILNTVSAAAKVIPVLSFIGDEVSSWVLGPKSDDLVRLGDALEGLVARRRQLEIVAQMASRDPLKDPQIIAIDAEIAATKTLISDGQKLIVSRLKTGKATDELVEVTAAATDETVGLTKAQLKAAAADEKRAEAISKTINEMSFQGDLAREELLATKAGEAALAAFNREKYTEIEVRGLGAGATSLDIALLREEAGARHDAEKALSDYIEEQEALVDAAEDATKAAEKTATATAKAWETMAERMQGALADSFYTMIDDGKFTADSLVDIFKRMAAEIAAQKVFLSFGIGGGGGGGGAGGIGGSGLELGDLLSLTGSGGLSSIAAGAISGVSSLGAAGNAVFGQGAMAATTSAGGSILNAAGGVGDAAFESAVMSGGLEQGFNLQSGVGMIANAVAGYAGAWAGTRVGESLFGKEAESAWGAAAGAMIGSAWGPIGAALGGAIGGMIDVAFGGDGKERVSLGVMTEPGAINNPNLSDVASYSVNGASGLELTTYTKRVGEDGQAAAEALANAMAATDTALTGLFGALGTTVDLSGEMLQGKSPGAGTDWAETFFGSAEFNGLNEGDINSALDDFVDAWLAKVEELTGAVVDISAIKELSTDSEVLGDTINRLMFNLGGVNTLFGGLGWQLAEVSIAGMAAADAMVAAFGGLENLSGAVSRYYELYYTEEEKVNAIREQVAGVIGELNQELPTTLQGFRDLVESYDPLTTEGAKAIATLLSVADSFALVATASESAADTLAGLISELQTAISVERESITDAHNTKMDALEAERKGIEDGVTSARDAVDVAFAGLKRWGDVQSEQINAAADAQLAGLSGQQDAIRAAYQSTADDIAESLAPVGARLKDLEATAGILRGALAGLRIESAAYSRHSRVQALSKLQAGGLSGDALKNNVGNATNIDKSEFATFVDYATAVGDTRTALGGLLSETETDIEIQQGILSAGQERLEQAQKHQTSAMAAAQLQVETIIIARDAALKATKEQIKLAESQILAIDGVDTSIYTLTEFNKTLATFEQTALLAEDQLAAIDEQVAAEEEQFRLQNKYLDKLVDFAKDNDRTLRGVAGSARSLAAILATIAVDMGLELPAFASGGFHSGGLALVGERGPEIVSMGPARVFSNSDSKNMLSGDAAANELRQLRQYFEGGIRALAKNTADIKKLNDKADGWDRIGLLTRTA